MTEADLMRRIELERADAARTALESAAEALEARHANKTYKRAWEIAAELIRELKPR
ncbi:MULTISPECIES: hypothetical protein [unclassified Bradyrhizobium]